MEKYAGSYNVDPNETDCWNVETTMEKIVEWSDAYLHGGNYVEVMKKQIREFCEG